MWFLTLGKVPNVFFFFLQMHLKRKAKKDSHLYTHPAFACLHAFLCVRVCMLCSSRRIAWTSNLFYSQFPSFFYKLVFFFFFLKVLHGNRSKDTLSWQSSFDSNASLSRALIKLALTGLNGRGSKAIRHAIRQTAALWFPQKTDACSVSATDLASASSLVGTQRPWYFQDVEKNKRALKHHQPISSSYVKALWKWCLTGLWWWLDRLPCNTHNKHSWIRIAVHVLLLSDAGTYYCIHTVDVMPVDLSVEYLWFPWGYTVSVAFTLFPLVLHPEIFNMVDTISVECKAGSMVKGAVNDSVLYKNHWLYL